MYIYNQIESMESSLETLKNLEDGDNNYNYFCGLSDSIGIHKNDQNFLAHDTFIEPFSENIFLSVINKIASDLELKKFHLSERNKSNSEYIITFKNDGGNIIKLHNIPNSHFYISVQPNGKKEEKLDSIEIGNQSNNLCFYHSIESAILALGLIKNGNEIDSTLEIVKACISSKYFNKDSYKKDELKIRFLISLLNTTERRLQEAKYGPNVIRLLKLRNNIIEELKNLSPLYNFAKTEELINEIVSKEMEFNEKELKDEDYNELISYIKNGDNKDKIKEIIINNKHIFCEYLPNEDSNELNDNNYINYYLTDNKNDSNERILLELLHYYNEAYYSEDDVNKKNDHKIKLEELIKIAKEKNLNSKNIEVNTIITNFYSKNNKDDISAKILDKLNNNDDFNKDQINELKGEINSKLNGKDYNKDEDYFLFVFDKKSNTIFHKICKNGTLDDFKYFAKKEDRLIAYKNENLETPFDLACKNNKPDIVKYLIDEKKIYKNIDLNADYNFKSITEVLNETKLEKEDLKEFLIKVFTDTRKAENLKVLSDFLLKKEDLKSFLEDNAMDLYFNAIKNNNPNLRDLLINKKICLDIDNKKKLEERLKLEKIDVDNSLINKITEQKSEEVKPEEQKPIEQKPEEQKPEEKPIEQESEVKPIESKKKHVVFQKFKEVQEGLNNNPEEFIKDINIKDEELVAFFKKEIINSSGEKFDKYIQIILNSKNCEKIIGVFLNDKFTQEKYYKVIEKITEKLENKIKSEGINNQTKQKYSNLITKLNTELIKVKQEKKERQRRIKNHQEMKEMRLQQNLAKIQKNTKYQKEQPNQTILVNNKDQKSQLVYTITEEDKSLNNKILQALNNNTDVNGLVNVIEENNNGIAKKHAMFLALNQVDNFNHLKKILALIDRYNFTEADKKIFNDLSKQKLGEYVGYNGTDQELKNLLKEQQKQQLQPQRPSPQNQMFFYDFIKMLQVIMFMQLQQKIQINNKNNQRLEFNNNMLNIVAASLGFCLLNNRNVGMAFQ